MGILLSVHKVKCKHKKKYFSQDEAYAGAIRVLNSSKKTSAVVYTCPHCKNLHVTTDKRTFKWHRALALLEKESA